MEIKLIFMSNSFSVSSTSYRIHPVYMYMHILMTVNVGSLLFVALQWRKRSWFPCFYFVA